MVSKGVIHICSLQPVFTSLIGFRDGGVIEVQISGVLGSDISLPKLKIMIKIVHIHYFVITFIIIIIIIIIVMLKNI